MPVIIFLIILLGLQNIIDDLEYHFGFQITILGLSVIPYAIWFFLAYTYSSCVPIFEIENNLLGKESINHELGAAIYEFAAVYLVIAILGKVSQWTMSAAYGCVASIASSCLIEGIELLSRKDFIPEIVVFIIPLIISLICMRIGFHSLETWIDVKHEILGLVFGIIPSIAFTFITICNIFTMAFDEAVVDNMGFVVLAVVLDVALYGVGIFLYFRHGDIFWTRMLKKIGIDVRDEIVSEVSTVYVKGDNGTLEERTIHQKQENKKNKKKSNKAIKEPRDMTLNSDMMEKIRKNNK